MTTTELRADIISGKGYSTVVNKLKIEVIKEAFKITHGNITRTCKLLKMHRNTFHRNVIALQIEKDLEDLKG